MRNLRPLLALAFVAAAASSPLRAQADSAITINYDQDTDSTTVSLVVPFSGKAPRGRVFGGKGAPDFTWTIGFSGAGKDSLAASTITSVFAFHEGMSAAYYNAHLKQLGAMDHLELVLDGQAVPAILLPPVIGAASADARGRVSLDLTYAAVFAPDMLRRIAEAAEAEGRLHGKSFVIDDAARRSLRELVSHLAPAHAAVADRSGK